MKTSTPTKANAARLVAACDDPKLLGFDLWPVQRRLLEAVEQHRVNVWALGRRSGKTTTAAIVGVHSCCLRPELRGHLRAGERGYAVAVATNLRQARLIVSAARSIAERSPLLRPLIESVSDDEVAFTTGMTFAAFPATSRGGRGWPIAALIFDELAHMLDGDGNSAAESVWRALLPSTAQFGPSATVIASSTPWGQEGLFASLYAQAASGELADAHAEHATTAEANPTVDPAFLAAEEARDPDSYASEYLAKFVGGGASFLDPERVADAVADRGELLPEQATSWVAGIDPSFSRDPFALVLAGRDPSNPARLLVGKAQAWLPRRIEGAGGSFEQRRTVEDWLLGEVAEVCRRYKAKVVTDQHCAPAVVERLRRAGLSVTLTPWTAQSKTDAFSELRARLYAGTIELLDHPDLLRELRSLRTRYAARHASVVTHRIGGSHSDLAVALAMATFAHHRPPGNPDGGAVFGQTSGLIRAMYGRDSATLAADGRTSDIRYGDSY